MSQLSEKEYIFIALATDSLSLGRPWNQKKPNEDPQLASNHRHTWPYKLQYELRLLFANKTIDINNYANRGSGVGMAKAKARDLFSWMDADITVFQFGISDCWIRGENFDQQKVTTEVFEKDFKEIMELKKTLNPEQPCFVVGLIPTNEHMLSKCSRQNEAITEYNDAIKRCLTENVHFIDMEEQFAEHGEKILHPDGHHLSNFGHDLLSSILIEKINIQIR